jgi:hypothetical protein
MLLLSSLLVNKLQKRTLHAFLHLRSSGDAIVSDKIVEN